MFAASLANQPTRCLLLDNMLKAQQVLDDDERGEVRSTQCLPVHLGQALPNSAVQVCRAIWHALSRGCLRAYCCRARALACWHCMVSCSQQELALQAAAQAMHVACVRQQGSLAPACDTQACTAGGHVLLKPTCSSVSCQTDECAQLLEDAKDESSKYGVIEAVCAPRPPPSVSANAGSRVYIMFKDPDGASKAKAVFHGRQFDGNEISATYVGDDEFARAAGGQWVVSVNPGPSLPPPPGGSFFTVPSAACLCCTALKDLEAEQDHDVSNLT